MTYEELDNLCGKTHRENRKWRAYICSREVFWRDRECPHDCGEIRVRLAGRLSGIAGTVVVSKSELAAHTEESLELLIDEIGISALLSQGVEA